MSVLDLAKERPHVIETFVREGKKAIEEDGADVLIPGCMSMAFLGIAEDVQKELGIPVLNPAAVALKTAELYDFMEEQAQRAGADVLRVELGLACQFFGKGHGFNPQFNAHGARNVTGNVGFDTHHLSILGGHIEGRHTAGGADHKLIVLNDTVHHRRGSGRRSTGRSGGEHPGSWRREPSPLKQSAHRPIFPGCETALPTWHSHGRWH